MSINQSVDTFLNKIKQFGWSIYGQYAWDNNSQKTALLEDLILKKLVQNQKSANEWILDAGCGTGNYAIKLFTAGFNVIGIDYAKGMINQANKKLRAHKTNSIEFHCLSLTHKLPYDDNFFDNVIMISVLQTVSKPIFALNEIQRILKPGGNLILAHFPKSEYHKLSLSSEVELKLATSKGHGLLSKVLLYIKSFVERKGATNYWTFEELVEIVSKARLTILESENTNPIVLTAQKQ